MSKEAKLGLFVLAVIVVFTFFTVNMGALFFKKGERTFKVYFDTVGTLETGAPVKQAGLDVGIVEKKAKETIYNPTKTTYIVTTIRVSNDADIAVDSKGSIQTMGIMGEQFIEITFGSSPVSATAETRIYGEGPAKLDDVIEHAVTLSNEVQKTVKAFNNIIGDPQTQQNLVIFINNLEEFSAKLNNALGGESDRLTQIMANAEAASANLESLIATAEVFITDVHSIVKENKSDLHKTIANTASITDTIKKDIMGDVKLAVGNLNDTAIDIREFVTDLRSFSTKLNESIDEAKSIITKLGGSVDENRPELKETFRNIRKLTETADSASKRVDNLLKQIQERDGLVHKVIYDEEMSQNTKKTIHKAEGVLNTFSEFPDRLSLETQLLYFPDRHRFNPDDDHLRADMTINYDFSDSISAAIGGNNLGSSNDIEAQLYYKWGQIYLHGGVIESEVGLGVDWHIFDRWMVGAEAIGLTDYEDDRIDVYSEFNIWKNIYLRGGVQDIGDERFPNFGVKMVF